MKIICKYLAGSYSYGLNGPGSDTDYRGVYINTDISKIIGLDKDTVQQNQGNGVDEVYNEFKNILGLLRGGNTQAVEMVYNDVWDEITEEWREVQRHRQDLLSSSQLFECLKGYSTSELKLANGERTGKLGGKRRVSLDQYGFSPKNFVNLLRLTYCGEYYFHSGIYPVNIFKVDRQFHSLLYSIKYSPQNYTKEQLNEIAADRMEKMERAFFNRQYNTEFDENLANHLCVKIYYPLLSSYVVSKLF